MHESCTIHLSKMSCNLQLLIVLAVVFCHQAELTICQEHTYSARVIESNSGACPTEEELVAVNNEIRLDVQRLLTVYDRDCGGTSGWALLTYLDMGNTSHQRSYL